MGAKKYRPALCGSSGAEVGRISMLLDKVHNLKMKATIPCYVSGDAEATIEEVRPILKGIVDAMGQSQWIAGANLTWLDFYMAENLELLDGISDRLFALENLSAAWADDNKCMKVPFNNKMAKLLNC